MSRLDYSTSLPRPPRSRWGHSCFFLTFCLASLNLGSSSLCLRSSWDCRREPQAWSRPSSEGAQGNPGSRAAGGTWPAAFVIRQWPWFYYRRAKKDFLIGTFYLFIRICLSQTDVQSRLSTPVVTGMSLPAKMAVLGPQCHLLLRLSGPWPRFLEPGRKCPRSSGDI